MQQSLSGKPPKRKFKKRYLVFVLGLSYPFFNYSCPSFRSTASETRAFFELRNVTSGDATLPIGDRKIHYIRTGKADAPTLVFIHGSPGSWDAWKTYLSDSALLQRFRLIAPDPPGFGQLTQNVLIMQGTEDRSVPYENVPFMKTAFIGIQNLQIIPIEKERHFIVWDSENLIKSSLLHWLKARN